MYIYIQNVGISEKHTNFLNSKNSLKSFNPDIRTKTSKVLLCIVHFIL